jgi:hypothetical protein
MYLVESEFAGADHLGRLGQVAAIVHRPLGCSGGRRLASLHKLPVRCPESPG